MDTAARQLSLDPAELRRRNMIRPEQMPYTNAMGQTYDSGKFDAVLTQGWRWPTGKASRRARRSPSAGKLRGRGLASFLEWTGANVFEERVTVAVTGSGDIEIYAATQEMGQGIATSYAQLAVDVFGVPLERIRIVQGDTDRGTGFGSAGSRSLVHRRLGGEGRPPKPRSRRPRSWRPRRWKPRRSTSNTATACSASPAPTSRSACSSWRRGSASSRSTSTPPARAGPTWPNGCHVCEVEIDPDTGEVRSCPSVGQRRRPRGQPDDRPRPARRRRGAGHRPGAVRAGGLRPRVRPAADRQADGLRAAARRHDRRAASPSSTSPSPA